MKENSGLSARKRRQRLACQSLSGVIIFYGFTSMIYQSHYSGNFVPDIDVDAVTGKKRHRRRPNRHHQQFHPEQPTAPQDAVLEGYLSLVDLDITSTSGLQATDEMAERTNNEYKGVIGVFCAIDWTLQQRNPSTVPMFRDLRAQSRMCEGTELRLNLYEITRQAEEFDASSLISNRRQHDERFFLNETFSSLSTNPGSSLNDVKRPIVRALQPTGVIFHETRCGSTLAANILAKTNKHTTRVYSESNPPNTALKACGDFGGTRASEYFSGLTCNHHLHQQLIRDVFYMMGRKRIDADDAMETQRHYAFYKFQSLAVHHIQAFTTAFPETPWVFLYRNSVEVMQSHLKTRMPMTEQQTLQRQVRNPVCLRLFGQKKQPTIIQEVVEASGKRMADLTRPEYCAANLAALSESALQEYYRSKALNAPVDENEEQGEDGNVNHSNRYNHQLTNSNRIMGRFVNYNQLPEIIWESVLPDHFGIPVTAEARKEMEETAGVYSKGRGEKANAEWAEDSTFKQQTATDDVYKAASVFLGDAYRLMEELSSQHKE